LAAQPLVSHLRHQAQQGVIRPITRPDGQPAPVSHQHANDTTLHALQPSDAQAALDSSIALFCAATCSQVNVNKSQGFLVQAQPHASASVPALPSTSFITGQQKNRYLGVLLGYDMQAAPHQQFKGIHHAISAKVRHWAARGLSFLGRVYVAKQVLAASLWYHVSFQRPSEQLLKQLSRSATAMMLWLWHKTALRAEPICPLLPLRLHPLGLTSSLPLSKGGVGLVHVPTQVQALQARTIFRLLEPERLAWRVFQLYHLS